MKKRFSAQSLKNDILSGVIVALVSIPISIGYAQVSGLPPVYGLYGSLLPVLVFGLLTSSPQFVMGVDAMPAAMVGSTLSVLGIASGSEEALGLVPVITLLTAAWLLVFYFIRAGRVVNYISTPVMGGFISGVGCTIILMQLPKLFGGSAGTGELFQLLYHIGTELDNFHPLSAALGFGTVAVLLVCKRLAPRFPMSVVLMAAGAALTAALHLDRYGVKLLPQVASGLSPLRLPDLRLLGGHTIDLIMLALTIALVIMAQTLLATNNYALKYNYKVDNGRELIAYAAANLAGSLVGCCPINGSVSRTGMADQFGCRSQVMSVTAAATMLLVLLFGTGLLAYLPVPVLTGIVIAALLGVLDIGLAKKLWRANKNEFFIFLMAFLGVLVLGTIYGVLTGMLLSFAAVVVRAVVPPKAFLGVIPGHNDFYSLQRNRSARPVAHTVIYQFSGNLFFANINTFQQDIENAVKADTKQVIVDGSGIGNIDVTAANRLVILNRNLREKGVRFYLTEHVGAVNDLLRTFGAGSLIEEGAVRRTVSLALRDAGVEKPYPLEGGEAGAPVSFVEDSERLAEFEWAFGPDAEGKLAQIAREVAGDLAAMPGVDVAALEAAEGRNAWGRVGLFDEEELLDDLELSLLGMARSGQLEGHDIRALEEKIEQRRLIVEEKLYALNPKALDLLRSHRKEAARHLQSSDPDAYARLTEARRELYERLKQPEPAEKLKGQYDERPGENDGQP